MSDTEFTAASEVAIKPGGRRVFEMSEQLVEKLSSGWTQPVVLTSRRRANGTWELLGRNATVEDLALRG